MKFNSLVSNLLILLLTFSNVAFAKRRLILADSMVSCMDSSQVAVSRFDIVFDADERAITYDIDITTELSGKLRASLEVQAFGFTIINKIIDVCDIGWKQFCPIYPGKIQIKSRTIIEQKYVNEVPGIAYTFPDIDAIARVYILDSNGNRVACLQVNCSNGRTVSHVGAQWATAVVAGIGLLASGILSAFGNSAAASHLSAVAISLFTYFQSVVIIAMLHVQEVPPIASAWSENLTWSMGLIRVTFMQKIFRWYIQATGGSPTLYLSSSQTPVLVQRSLDKVYEISSSFSSSYLTPLMNVVLPLISGSSASSSSSSYNREIGNTNDNGQIVRYTKPDDFLYEKRELNEALESTDSLVVLRGIERVGFKADIENTSIVVTGFTFFVLCGYVLVGAFLMFKTSAALADRHNFFKKRLVSPDFHKNWKTIFKGVINRYVFIGFPQLVILSLWEFTVVDSPAVVVIAVLFLILVLAIMGWASYRTIKFGRLSVQTYKNPAALLYGDSSILNRYGFFYTMFDANKYWFGTVIIVYVFIKSIFVSLAQGSGKTQALVIFIIDLAFLIYSIIEKPYLNRVVNILNISISVVTTVNSFFFLFFSNLFGQPRRVSSIFGLIFFFMNAIFTVILLIMIIILTLLAIFSRNADVRFAPVNDDRNSFQKKYHRKNNNNSEFYGSGSDDEKRRANRLDDYGEDNSIDINELPEGADELLAMGAVARDHQKNWAGEMYKLKDYVENEHRLKSSSNVNSSSSGSDKNLDKPLELTKEEEGEDDGRIGAKLIHQLTAGKSKLFGSLRRKNSKKTSGATNAAAGAAGAAGTGMGTFSGAADTGNIAAAKTIKEIDGDNLDYHQDLPIDFEGIGELGRTTNTNQRSLNQMAALNADDDDRIAHEKIINKLPHAVAHYRTESDIPMISKFDEPPNFPNSASNNSINSKSHNYKNSYSNNSGYAISGDYEEVKPVDLYNNNASNHGYGFNSYNQGGFQDESDIFKNTYHKDGDSETSDSKNSYYI
ncbi:hypothetical protein BVG19_g1684 [[Candida] boidinii]|nr:hypothetical protein BVG19_g1684 [[Candida] boidinii]OWB52393.1 hypothetical protein B5S27_g3968 [[Candida] boidinii]